MSIRRLRYKLVFGGAALVAAATTGSVIGGLGSSPLGAMQVTWQPPTNVAQAVPTATLAPTVTQTPTKTALPRRTATPKASAAPSVAPTPQVAPTPISQPAALAPISPPAEPELVEYTVQPGDILALLATRFNTTPETIIALNPQINPDSLVIGDVLRLPNAGN